MEFLKLLRTSYEAKTGSQGGYRYRGNETSRHARVRYGDLNKHIYSKSLSFQSGELVISALSPWITSFYSRRLPF
jgi:hypothetical protein